MDLTNSGYEKALGNFEYGAPRLYGKQPETITDHLIPHNDWNAASSLVNAALSTHSESPRAEPIELRANLLTRLYRRVVPAVALTVCALALPILLIAVAVGQTDLIAVSLFSLASFSAILYFWKLIR